jgi:AAHS family benzoate transporter-like MFS transporter
VLATVFVALTGLRGPQQTPRPDAAQQLATTG